MTNEPDTRSLETGETQTGIRALAELVGLATRLNEAWDRFGASDGESYRVWELQTGEELFK